MPSFVITDKASGKKYKVTGPSKERALEVWRKKQASGELDAVAKPKAEINPDTMQPEGVPAFVPRDKEGKPLAGYDPATGTMGHSKMDQTGAFTTAATDAVPIVGPYLTKSVNKAAAALVTPFSDSTFAENEKEISGYGPKAQADNPGYALGGRVTGTVAPMLALGTTALGARALGITGNSLGARVLASAATSGGIGGADTAARGGTLTQSLTSARDNALIGGAVPLASEGVGEIVKGVYKTVAPYLGRWINPAKEAERRVGTVYGADVAKGNYLGAADEAAAVANGQPIINADRAGPQTRAMLRDAAAVNPDDAALIKKTVDTRFETQSDRANTFIDRISNGKASDTDLQDEIAAGKKAVNDPAYKAAMTSKAAQNMDSPELLGLLASPSVRKAVVDAEKTGADRAVVAGHQTIKNPFVIDDAGNVSLRDPKVKPTLAFWNEVKINLDSQISKAAREGDKAAISNLRDLKAKLVGELDNAVPEYKTARQGAAEFFQAENMLDAGKQFVTSKYTNEEVARVLAKAKPAERQAFAIGFASRLKKVIDTAGDRKTDVINKIWGNPAAREKLMTALGPKHYAEFEQFVNVETAMDSLRGAVTRPNIMKQLTEAGLSFAGNSGVVGLGAGAGTFQMTGDWKKSLTAGVIAAALRARGAKVDAAMAKQVVNLLMSDDPAALQRAVTMASRNPDVAKTVRAVQSLLSSFGTDVSRPDGGALSGHPRITIDRNTPAAPAPSMAQ